MDGEMDGWKYSVNVSKIIVYKFVIFLMFAWGMDGKSNNEWNNRLTENARKKIKLTKFGIGKYVQEYIFDIWLNWWRIGKMEGRRKKEGKKEESGIKGKWKEKEKREEWRKE